MTEPRRPAPARRPGPLPLAATALSAFLVLLALLAAQVRAGRDPALGAGKLEQRPAPRQIIVKRIVERRVVRRPGGSPAPAAPTPARAPAAQAAAPAPAPAPAPVVTRSS
jgi:hypothetical protein